jgi:hypothetical protein
MTNLGDDASRQAAHDATSKHAVQSGSPQAAVAWFFTLSWKTKFVVVAAAMFLAYAVLNTLATAIGLRPVSPGAMLDAAGLQDDPSLPEAERARRIVARELAEKKARQTARNKQAVELAKQDAEEARLRDAVRRERDKVQIIDPAHDRLREIMQDMLAKKQISPRLGEAQQLIREYYATIRTGEAYDAQYDAELGHAKTMPFESAAALILKYFGKASPDAIWKAIRDLRVDHTLDKPEQMRVFEQEGRRPALYPDVPKLLPSTNVTVGSMDGKLPTAEEVAEAQLLHAKWQLQDAILGIYKDCEEHYRPLYNQHLKSLFELYLSRHGQMVQTLPQDKFYPLFLMTDRASPNERLGGALVLLWRQKLTAAARELVLATPDAILGKSCPVDRRAFHFVGSDRGPEPHEVVIVPVSNLATFTKADLPQALLALQKAYETCKPTTRWYFVHWMRNVASKVTELSDRRPGGDRLLQTLASSDRTAVYNALQEAFTAPAMDVRAAAVLPEAASRLFYDSCPGILTAEAELAAYRVEVAERKAASDKALADRRAKTSR